MSEKAKAIAYPIEQRVVEARQKQLKKEEQEAKDLAKLINSDALRSLCTRYDNKMGEYPENMHEGAAFFEYIEKLKAEIEKENE